MALAAVGVHWNAETLGAFLPSDFVLKVALHLKRYGVKKFIPQGCTIQDWGVTYGRA